jgi:hypothetical protein
MMIVTKKRKRNINVMKIITIITIITIVTVREDIEIVTVREDIEIVTVKEDTESVTVGEGTEEIATAGEDAIVVIGIDATIVGIAAFQDTITAVDQVIFLAGITIKDIVNNRVKNNHSTTFNKLT